MKENDKFYFVYKIKDNVKFEEINSIANVINKFTSINQKNPYNLLEPLPPLEEVPPPPPPRKNQTSTTSGENNEKGEEFDI